MGLQRQTLFINFSSCAGVMSDIRASSASGLDASAATCSAVLLLAACPPISERLVGTCGCALAAAMACRTRLPSCVALELLAEALKVLKTSTTLAASPWVSA